ncbi:MAG: hypothetical protein WBC92_10060 [Terracidiphilus sp.]
MRTLATPQAESWRGTLSRLRSRLRKRRATSISLFAATLLLPLLAGASLSAQTSQVPASMPAQKPASTSKDSRTVQPAPQPPMAPTPAAPKASDWPANNPPQSASVVLDSHGLTVVASNSSLTQILKEISLETGAKVEGMNKDERIFGSYGPGPARDVLYQLLDGSNYNVLIVGDQRQGAPLRVVLTPRTSGSSHDAGAVPSPPSEQDSGVEEISQEPQPEEPPPPQAQPAPGMPVRTQQQMIEEMQERQRQLEQQQNPQN